KVLHYPKDDQALHSSFVLIRKRLDEMVQNSEKYAQQSQAHGTNDPVTVIVANRLFGQSGYSFKPEFQSLLNNDYAAPFEQLDFVRHSAVAADHINDWVETQTRKRIRKLIPQGALNEMTRLVLVNALYLKTPWAEPFQTAATKPDRFYVNGTQTFDVPMMT